MRLTLKRRAACVRCVIDGRLIQADAARRFKVHYTTVAKWLKRYRKGGEDGLRSRVVRGRNSLSDENIAAILKEIRAGKSYKVIGHRWLVGDDTISRIATKHGIRRRPQSLTKRRKQSLYAAMRRGTTSFPELAQRYGISKTTIRRFANEAGIRPPPRRHQLRRFTPEQKQSLLEIMRLRKTPFSELAQRYNVHIETIRWHAKKAGIKPPIILKQWEKLSLDQQAKFRRLVALYVSYSEIAERFKVSKSSASKWARNMGMVRGPENIKRACNIRRQLAYC